MRLLTLFLLLIPALSFGQAPKTVPFAAGNKVDTAKPPGSLRIDSAVRLVRYSNSDTNKFLTVGPTGMLELRAKTGGGSSTIVAGYGLTKTGDTLSADTSELATQYDLTQINGGVWLFMPSAFSVTGQGSDSLTVSMPGLTSQYLRGNGTPATFPTNVSTFTNDAGYLTAEVQNLESVLTNGNTSGHGMSLFSGSVLVDTVQSYPFILVDGSATSFGSAQLGPGIITLTETTNPFSQQLLSNTAQTAGTATRLPKTSGTLLNDVTPTDIEITDDTKGIIQESPNGTRWRVTIDNDGIPTYTSL